MKGQTWVRVRANGTTKGKEMGQLGMFWARGQRKSWTKQSTDAGKSRSLGQVGGASSAKQAAWP